MVLRIQCPNCGNAYRLQDPLPPEGKRYRCKCSAIITVAYPEEVRARLRDQEAAAAAPAVSPPAAAPIPPPAAAPVPPPAAPASAPPPPRQDGRQDAPTQVMTARPNLWDKPDLPPMAPPPGPPPKPRGLTAPPSMPPLEQSLRREPTAPRGELTTPTAPPPLESRPAPVPPPLAAPKAPPPLPPRRVARVTTEDDDAPTVAEPPHAAVPPPAPMASSGGLRVSTSPAERRPTPPIAPSAPRWEDDEPADEPSGDEPMEAPDRSSPVREPSVRKKTKRTKRAGFFGKRWVRWSLIAASLAVIVGASTVVGVIAYYSQGLPSVESLAVYEPPVGTIVTDEQGNFVGEFFKEQRYVTPFEEIPDNLKNAFVSAEDAAFWEHSGLDFMGIARAMLKNIQERRMAQGASTITQQVARSFLLTREKKLARKIKEAILAYRIENNFSKEHILYLYLNQIFLGHGAYGVQAAAHLYFDKDVQDLELAEAAIIAGLPQAPSNYSPNRNFKAAKKRQRYVLDQMARREYVTQEAADAAYEQELVFTKKRDRNLDIAPFYVEHVRRYLFERYKEGKAFREENPDAEGRHPWEGIHPLRSGLTVTIPIDIELQKVANEAVRHGVRFADKRIGWRGAPKNLESDADRAKERTAIDKERVLALRPYHPGFDMPEGAVPADVLPPATEGEITRGVIAEIGRKWALVDVGSLRGVLHVSDFTWCHNVNPEVNFRYFKCQRLDDVLKVGDVIGVKVVNTGESWAKTLPKKHPERDREYPRLSMEQDPGPEASLLSMRVTDGGVLAMVGGSSYVGSEFNRAVQARRQVGSTFKPLVYAAALDDEDNDFTASSILVDAPIVEAMSGKDGELWKPGNSGGEYLGDTTFRRGLILSRNIVTLKICQQMGVKYALEYVERFGFESPIDPNLASCLGASAITLKEMLRAYTVFPTLGSRVEPRFITEIRDRNGNVLEKVETEVTPEVMDEKTAYIMVNLMTDVIRSGTARKGLEVGVPVAGKTGTTNAFRDAWFMGYTPEVLTGVWVGFDEFKTMGRGQYGGEVALPMWVEYMKAAVESYPPSEYEKPDKIKFVRVDSMTGKLAHEGEPAQKVPYVKGTEPKELAPKQGQVDAADFLSGEY